MLAREQASDVDSGGQTSDAGATVPDELTNKLYYRDNLEILREHVPAAGVCLVYLDPPFNSNRDYNVILKDESGNRPPLQHVADVQEGAKGGGEERGVVAVRSGVTGGC